VVNTLTWDPTSPQKNRIEIGENKNEEEKNNRKTMKKKTLHTKKVTSKNFFSTFYVVRDLLGKTLNVFLCSRVGDGHTHSHTHQANKQRHIMTMSELRQEKGGSKKKKVRPYAQKTFLRGERRTTERNKTNMDT